MRKNKYGDIQSPYQPKGLNNRNTDDVKYQVLLDRISKLEEKIKKLDSDIKRINYLGPYKEPVLY